MLDRSTTRFPSDRAYGRLHWFLMGLIAAILLYGLVLSRWIDTPRGLGIRMIAVMVLAFNGLWWSIADRRFARFVRSEARSRLARLLLIGFMAAINVPIFQLLITGRPPSFLGTPIWYAAAVTIWTISLPLLMPIIDLLRLAVLGVAYAIRRIARPRPSNRPPVPGVLAGPADCPAEIPDPSRRAFLQTVYAAAPIVLLGGLTVASRTQQGRFLVNRHTLPAPWLPDRLRGLTITHISDMHVGRLFRPNMLPRLVDAANALDSDIVVVTGDVVDNSNDMLPPAIEALSQLRHRHGLFICIGNHDQLDNRADFIRYTRARLPLLINERRCPNIGGERLTIAGLDYASSEGPGGRGPGFLADIADTLAGHNPATEGPVIALAHHPHEWDCLARANVPLTLSGHTHGGQIMFTPPGEHPDVGIGRLVFRYTRGFYRAESSTLFVSTGVGAWFPVNLRAPTEIVQMRLT